jgi:hypothetical protein
MKFMQTCWKILNMTLHIQELTIGPNILSNLKDCEGYAVILYLPRSAMWSQTHQVVTWLQKRDSETILNTSDQKNIKYTIVMCSIE